MTTTPPDDGRDHGGLNGDVGAGLPSDTASAGAPAGPTPDAATASEVTGWEPAAGEALGAGEPPRGDARAVPARPPGGPSARHTL